MGIFQLLYTTLVPHIEQLHSILGARIDHNEGQQSMSDPPSFIALFKDIPHFPLFPVVKPVEEEPPAATPPLEKVR